MNAAVLISIVVVVAVVILLLALFSVSRRRAAQRSEEQRGRSREEFGSEYERTARERGSEEEAERELRERRGSVERRVEPLSDESRGRFEERWGEVERVFVDNPERSIEMADRTVSDVLTERNFVSDAGQSDEETERSLAVMHPDVADDYREARRSGRKSWRARPGVRTKTRARSPQKTCGRPSANTARSTSGSCGDTEVIGGTAWKRWLPDSDDYILRANFSRSRPRSETDLAVRITIAGK